MAKNAQGPSDKGNTLGEIAESLGTLLGNAEKQWRAWQGPRDAMLQAVADVRDRASALLAEMGADVKKGYEKTKGDKKAGKKADRKARAGKAEKADKKAKKDEKKAGKKKGKKAKGADVASDEPLE